MWRALSDDRTGLPFRITAGPRQRSHSRVRVPWDSRPYFTVLDLRLPFFRLLRLAGLRWRYSIPPPHGSDSAGYCKLFYVLLHRVNVIEITAFKGFSTVFLRCSGYACNTVVIKSAAQQRTCIRSHR
jgi:hypothetical protein